MRFGSISLRDFRNVTPASQSLARSSIEAARQLPIDSPAPRLSSDRTAMPSRTKNTFHIPTWRVAGPEPCASTIAGCRPVVAGRTNSFCDRVVYSVAIPSERVNLIPTITKKRDPNRHGLIDSERRSCHKPRRRDLMQVSLAKCSRIEEDQIASHFIHRSDVDDVVFVQRVTSGALSCEFRIDS